MRHIPNRGYHVFEVDVFQGHHAGLVVAEVELPHEETPLSLPHWVGDEITHDSRYGNFTLAEQAALLHAAPNGTHAAPTPVLVASRGLPAAH